MNTKRYASLITHMDRAIGRLLAELDRLGLRENTLVIFASDNGAAKQAPLEELGCKGSLKGMKGQLYEGGHSRTVYCKSARKGSGAEIE